MATPRRDHLVERALALFNAHGYHATGIDKILADAGVAKMTLYNHFKSKDELILATLAARDAQFRRWLRRRVDRLAEQPGERLLAVFDALAEWFEHPEFHGCMFINAAAEYQGPDSPILAAAAEHKRHVYAYLQELALEAGLKRPRQLAAQLILLINGAIATAQIDPEAPAARQAKNAARTLIESHRENGAAV